MQWNKSNYFTSSDPHNDISKQLVDTTSFYLAFLSDILSGILSGIPSGILIWHSYLAFFSGILFGTLSDVLSGILSGRSFGILSGGVPCRTSTATIHAQCSLPDLNRENPRQVFPAGPQPRDSTPSWGPAGNTWRGFSRLRSGREHWAWMVAVEVRQGTLGVESRGWGPAGNTWRGYSRLRSGGGGGARGGGRQAEGGRRKSTNIKSNNPHLAGGELQWNKK